MSAAAQAAAPDRRSASASQPPGPIVTREGGSCPITSASPFGEKSADAYPFGPGKLIRNRPVVAFAVVVEVQNSTGGAPAAPVARDVLQALLGESANS